MTANDTTLTADHGPTSGCEGLFNMTTFKIALESLATITTADLVMFFVDSAIWSPPR